jgi:hypothetical protein
VCRPVQVFEYLNKRCGEVSTEQWAWLRRAPFVPVRRAADKKPDKKSDKGEAGAVQHVAPCEVFFALTCKKKFGPLLDYTDLKPGSPAGVFLSKCGVEEQPSVSALAAGVAANHGRTIAGMSGTSAYLGALKELSKALRDERGYGA